MDRMNRIICYCGRILYILSINVSFGLGEQVEVPQEAFLSLLKIGDEG